MDHAGPSTPHSKALTPYILTNIFVVCITPWEDEEEGGLGQQVGPQQYFLLALDVGQHFHTKDNQFSRGRSSISGL